jgi:hypothetical protein
MNTLADALISGHVLLADWLWLIAAVVFVVGAVIAASRAAKAWADTTVLTLAGLALTAVALLVL